MFNKVKKVQYGSRWSKKVQEGTKSFKKVQVCLLRLKKVQQGSRWFKMGKEGLGLRRFMNIQDSRFWKL